MERHASVWMKSVMTGLALGASGSLLANPETDAGPLMESSIASGAASESGQTEPHARHLARLLLAPITGGLLPVLGGLLQQGTPSAPSNPNPADSQPQNPVGAAPAPVAAPAPGDGNLGIASEDGQVRTEATGLISQLLPAVPLLPPLPVTAPNLPLPRLPKGILPTFTLDLPVPPALLQALVLPGLPSFGHNAETNTIASCGPDADLTQRSVFTEADLLPNNQVIAFARRTNGTLCQAGIFNTGGASDLLMGPIASGQNALIVDGGYVFVINQGSDAGPLGQGSLSVMKIENDRLVLTDSQPSGGPNPRSVTRYGNLVYVVNAGVGLGLLGPAVSVIPTNIQGFTFDDAAGTLRALTGSQQRTIDGNGDPAQIEFTPDGKNLVITQRHATLGIQSGAEPAKMEIVGLSAAGLPAHITQYDVGENLPFGFRFDDQGRLYLVHGNAQFPDAGAISSYLVGTDGSVNTITRATADSGSDTCWNYISRTTTVPNMYTSAFWDSNVSRSLINSDGSLTLVNPQEASTADTGGFSYFLDDGGLDMYGTVESTTGQEYLYILNIADPFPIGIRAARIVGFAIQPDGTLQKMGRELASGLPNTSFGMWAL